jgi:hypothetical protein
MAQRNIDFGSFPDDPNADAIRTAFDKVQQNFTELFSGLQDQGVISVNRTTGAGIVLSGAPTGNVVVNARIAQVTINSSTLALSAGGPGSASTATITSGAVPFFINLPANVTGVSNINLTSTLVANTVNVNLQINGNTANFIGNVGTTANVIAGANVYANSGTIFASLLTGTLTTAAQPNITSVGNLSSLNVSGSLSSGNANLGNAASANFFVGDGGLLTNVFATVPGTTIENGNSKVNIATANGNVTIAAVGNTTMTVTGTGANVTGTLDVTGNLTAGNLIGVLANGGTSNITIASATGNVTTAVSGIARITATSTGANVAGALGVSSTLEVTGDANVGNLGTAQVLASANVTAPQLISNVSTGTAPLVVSSTTQVANLNAATAGTATSATTAGTVTTNAQPNITSVGTLTSLAVTDNVTAGNVYANSGTVGANLLTGTLTTVAQPNITSIGTLTVLGVNGNIIAANINANTGVFTGNGSGLSAIAGANVIGTVSSATAASTAGTVTTAAQPNITSVGTLSSLSVSGNLSSGNANLGNAASANFFVGDGGLLTNIAVGEGSFIENGNSEVRVDANSNVRVSVAGNANVVTFTGTGATFGSGSGGNITGANLVSANFFTATGNITALNFFGNLVGNISGNIVVPGSNGEVLFNNAGSAGASNAFSFNTTSNALSVNGNIGANFFIGNGSQLTGVITGVGDTIANGNSNITIFSTSVGISANAVANVLTVNRNGANVTGTLGTTGNITAPFFIGNGSQLTGVIAGIGDTIANGNSNITIFSTSVGISANAVANVLTVNRNGANVTGTLEVTGRVIATGNISGTQLISNVTTSTAPLVVSSTTVVANLNADLLDGFNTATANTASTVAVRDANGNIAANFFIGSGNNLSNIQGANVIGTVANANFAMSTLAAQTAGTVTTGPQPNITTVGTLTFLTVTGNANVGGLISPTLTSNVATGTAPLTVTSTTRVANLNVAQANVADFISVAAGTGNNFIVFANAATGNVSELTSTGLTANLSNNSITATTFVGALSGAATSAIVANSANAVAGANVSGTVASATSATTAGTVTTAAQPNITSVGTLSSLVVSGNVVAGNLTTTGVLSATGSGVSSIAGSLDTTGNVSGGNLTTGGSLSVSGTGNIGGNLTAANLTVGSGSGGNITGANLISSNFFTGTLTTNAQPNITSVGTLTGILVSGNASFTGANVSLGSNANVRITGGSSGQVLTTDGAGNLSWVPTGTATTAQTVTTNAQPNITSVGTLTSLSVSGALTSTQLTTGANTTAGTITGNWTLTAGSRWQSTYADLAERYVADEAYEPGTVVVLGGEKEVTIENDADSHKVAGVVTTNPAYIMNALLEGENVVEVALIGRVPCKVVGPVNKGDLLTTANIPGYAYANNAASAGRIVGKSLENFSGELGIVEIMVGKT